MGRDVKLSMMLVVLVTQLTAQYARTCRRMSMNLEESLDNIMAAGEDDDSVGHDLALNMHQV